MKILVLNSGSSSQKACLYEIGATLSDHPPDCLWEGRVEFSGDRADLEVKNSRVGVMREQVQFSTRDQVVRHLLSTMYNGREGVLASLSEIDCVGHRIVHGGPNFGEPVLVTAEVRSAIAGASELAPLHIPAELEGMDVVENILGSIPQVAVFDTGFHRQMPLFAQIYPGPYEWYENGIRHYGFHGINHQYCAGRAAQLLKKDVKTLKLVTCHLGNGCSLAGIDGGRSRDTTMGFTPLDGLMMGTRSGAVDPGILIYLMRKNQADAAKIDHMLNVQHLGIFGCHRRSRAECPADTRRRHLERGFSGSRSRDSRSGRLGYRQGVLAVGTDCRSRNCPGRPYAFVLRSHSA